MVKFLVNLIFSIYFYIHLGVNYIYGTFLNYYFFKEAFTLAQSTVTKKREETAAAPKTAAAQIQEEVVSFIETFPNNWANNLDRIFDAYSESENILLDALESQRETWEKLTGDFTQINEEQKKLYEKLQELAVLNIQNVFGPQASKPVEQGIAQFVEVNNKIQQIVEAPYKEGLNLLNQAQDQFQQFARESVAQQQKIREDFKKEIIAATNTFIEIYEANIKASLAFFK